MQALNPKAKAKSVRSQSDKVTITNFSPFLVPLHKHSMRFIQVLLLVFLMNLTTIDSEFTSDLSTLYKT